MFSPSRLVIWLFAFLVWVGTDLGTEARADRKVDWSQYLETPADRAAQARQASRAETKQTKQTKRVGANKRAAKKHAAKKHAAKKHAAKKHAAKKRSKRSARRR